MKVFMKICEDLEGFPAEHQVQQHRLNDSSFKYETRQTQNRNTTWLTCCDHKTLNFYNIYRLLVEEKSTLQYQIVTKFRKCDDTFDETPNTLGISLVQEVVGVRYTGNNNLWL